MAHEYTDFSADINVAEHAFDVFLRNTGLTWPSGGYYGYFQVEGYPVRQLFSSGGSFGYVWRLWDVISSQLYGARHRRGGEYGGYWLQAEAPITLLDANLANPFRQSVWPLLGLEHKTYGDDVEHHPMRHPRFIRAEPASSGTNILSVGMLGEQVELHITEPILLPLKPTHIYMETTVARVQVYW